MTRIGGIIINNGTNLSAEMVLKWNQEQDKLRENLPTFFEALLQAQNGSTDSLELFFNFKKRIGSYFYDGKQVKSVDSYLVFMDKRMNNFLRHLRRIYSDNRGITQADGFAGAKYKTVATSMKFEVDEINSLFYDYLVSFVQKHDLNNFMGETDAHRDNKLYKYMKMDFENNVLKATYNERMDIDRVQIDNQQYLVKNRTEEVYFDDVKTGLFGEEGEELSFFEVVGDVDKGIEAFINGDEHEVKKYGRNEESQYIYDNYKDIFTKNQLEKFEQIMDWCNEEGNSVDDLFQRNNPNELSKSALSKILFPGRKTTSTMKDIDNLIKSMNSRMNKALGRDVVSPTEEKKTAIRSSYNKTNGTPSEERAFRKSKCNDGSKDKFPNHPMYDNIKKGFQKPSIAIGSDDNPNEMDKQLKQHLTTLQNSIWEGYIKFALDENNQMVADTDWLKPITIEDWMKLKGYVLSDRNLKILQTYYNNKAPFEQQKVVIKVKDNEPKIDEKIAMITPIELSRIRKESKK